MVISLGEMLNGDRLISAPYKIKFLEEKDFEVLCNKTLSKTDVSQFRSVIEKGYYIQLHYDDLPIWGFIGTTQRDYTDPKIGIQYFLFKHFEFEVYYNKDRVIEVRLIMNHSYLANVTEDEEVVVDFTYSVKWSVTQKSFDKRMEIYIGTAFLPHYMTIHHASITNSSLTLLILIICVLTFYVLVLRQDISKCTLTTWKRIKWQTIKKRRDGRTSMVMCLDSQNISPYLPRLLVLAASYFIVSILVLGLLGFFPLYVRGVFWNALVIVYAVTYVVSGYTSVSFYSQLKGTTWMNNLLVSGGLFFGPLFLTFCFLNSVAISYGATVALPLGGIIILSLILVFIASPLLLLGGFVGKHTVPDFQAPCRTTKCPREVPQQRWYRGLVPQMVLAGILPFSVIYVQLYYIFATVWGHRIYTLYGILFVVFVLLLIITALMSVVLTYFQLAVEDHEWWWRSFFCGGSTGLFIYGYCIYYHFFRSDMNSFMQISFFFGYMACVCYGIFLVLGTVGFRASLLFVRYLYAAIKCD